VFVGCSCNPITPGDTETNRLSVRGTPNGQIPARDETGGVGRVLRTHLNLCQHWVPAAVIAIVELSGRFSVPLTPR
jgi:hypothetical protein